MLINIIYIALIVIGLYNCGSLHGIYINRNDENVDRQHFIVCLATLIFIPVFLFAHIIPNAVVEGQKDIYTTVTNVASSKSYDVMVTFNIVREEFDHWKGDEEYTVKEIAYYPRVIHWSNGGESCNTLDDYGFLGDTVSFTDQEGVKYKVKITKPSFTYSEQLTYVPMLDKALYSIVFLSSVAIVASYLMHRNK